MNFVCEDIRGIPRIADKNYLYGSLTYTKTEDGEVIGFGLYFIPDSQNNIHRHTVELIRFKEGDKNGEKKAEAEFYKYNNKIMELKGTLTVIKGGYIN